MCKGGLSRGAPAHESPREPYDLTLALLTFGIQRYRIGSVMRTVEAIGEGRRSTRRECVELLAPGLLHEVDVVAHAAALPPVPCPANSRRYASMNGSMSPSITRCTSGIFNSVRWSFTIVYGWKT